MSFILDALKKSEIERQRQTIPGLVDLGPSRPRTKLPAWAIALCALLAVNLLVLSVVLIRGAASGRGAAVSGAAHPATAVPFAGDAARAPDASRGADAAPNDHFSPLDTPVYAPEIPVGAAPAPAHPEQPPAARPQSEVAAGRATHRHDPVLNEDDYKAVDSEVLPTIDEISLSGAQALPEMHLDVHVFATNSAERFVYINMRQYHEGATLAEGPTLERIRRDGVILDYQGLRFLLPRR
jgi:hypothetical protein